MTHFDVEDLDMKPMTPNPGVAINGMAENLDAVNDAIRQLSDERVKIITDIRGSAHDAIITFIDMVGSTQSKVDHAEEPEVWIFKVRQFYQVLSTYINQLGGRVVNPDYSRRA